MKPENTGEGAGGASHIVEECAECGWGKAKDWKRVKKKVFWRVKRVDEGV